MTLPRLPRDTLLVSDVPAVLAEAAGRGYPTCDITDRSPDWLQANWSTLTLRNPSAFLVCREERPDVAELQTTIGDGCARVGVNNNTGETRSRAWVAGILSQVGMLTQHAPAQALSGKLRNVPAFVIGAGPSLADDLEAAHQCQRRGVVFAINSASRLVRGQCVVTVEANDTSVKLEPRDSARIYALGAHPAVWASGTGPLLPTYTGEVSGPVERLAGWPRVPCSVSGSTAALSLAHMWGCSPIVLVGQDLSFPAGRIYADTDDRVHDDGTFAWSPRAQQQDRADPLPPTTVLLDLPGIGGGTVRTNLGLRNVGVWLESVAKFTDGPRLINATRAGLHLAGWQHERLDDVVAGMSTRGPSIAELVATAGPPSVTREGIADWLERAPDAFLDPYALPVILPLMRAHRLGLPSRSPWLEARAVRRLRRNIEAAAATCRAELETLCKNAAPRT